MHIYQTCNIYTIQNNILFLARYLIQNGFKNIHQLRNVQCRLLRRSIISAWHARYIVKCATYVYVYFVWAEYCVLLALCARFSSTMYSVILWSDSLISIRFSIWGNIHMYRERGRGEISLCNMAFGIVFMDECTHILTITLYSNTHQNFQCFCLILMDSNLGFVDDWYCIFVLFCAEQFVLLANGNTTHWIYCYFVYVYVCENVCFFDCWLENKIFVFDFAHFIR